MEKFAIPVEIASKILADYDGLREIAAAHYNSDAVVVEGISIYFNPSRDLTSGVLLLVDRVMDEDAYSPEVAFSAKREPIERYFVTNPTDLRTVLQGLAARYASDDLDLSV